MIKTQIPKAESLILKNGVFVERKFWTIPKLVCTFCLISILSCTYSPIEDVAIIPEPPTQQQIQENKFSEYIQKQNKNISEDDVINIVRSTLKWANHFKLDPNLLIAIQQVESGFNKFSISSGGALGVMQMIPSWHLDKLKTATKELGSPELFDPNVNIYVGAWVLKDCMKKFGSQTNYLRCYSGSNSLPNGYEDKVKASLYNIKKYVSV